MSKGLIAFFVSLLVATVIAVIGITIYCNWNAITGTINDNKYYTADDLQTSYDKGYGDGIGNETELTAKVEYFSDLVDGYYLTIVELENQNSDLLKSNEALKNSVNSLTEIKNNNETEISGLNEIIAENNTKIQENTIKIQEYQGQIAVLEQNAQNNQNQIVSLQNNISSLQNLNSNLQSVNESNLNTITLLNNQVVSLNSQISELTYQIQNNTSNVSSLNNKIAELEKSISYYEQYIASLENDEKVVATFEFNGSVYSIQVVNKNSKLSITNPESTDKVIFNGWLKDGELVDLNEFVITQNTKLVADITLKNKVVFKSDNEIVKTEFVTLSTKALEPEVSKEGYEFDGWTIDGKNIIDLTTYEISSDTTLMAVFTKLHNVKFIYEDSIMQTQTVRNGSYAQNLDIEDTEYKIFNGWKLNGTMIDINTHRILADTIFVADISYRYNVKFYIDDELYVSQIIDNNSFATLPDNPNKDNYEFDGWTINNNIVDIANYAITEDTSFIAKFTQLYEIKFISNGNIISSQIVREGSSFIVPANPNLSGYIFDGWTTDSENLVNIDNVIASANVSYNAKYTKIPYGLFDNNGVQINTWEELISSGNVVISNGTLSLSNNGKTLTGELRVADTITSIASYGFSGSKLSSVILSDSVIEIGSYAFYYNSTLQKIVLGNNLKYIRSNAFMACTSLKNLEFPSSLKIIENNAFQRCESLTSINIKENVESIGENSFSSCTKLENVVLNCNEVKKNAFTNCSELKSVTILSNVKKLYTSVFSSCSKIASIYLPSTLTSLCSSSEPSSFFGLNYKAIIYCESSSKQSGWGNEWNYISKYSELMVKYGYTYEQYLAEIGE